MENCVIHSRAANTDHRRTASLTFNRDEAERFANTRMHEQVGGAIILRQLVRFDSAADPGHRRGAYAFERRALLSVAHDQQVKFVRSTPIERRESFAKSGGIFFRR